MTGAEPAAAGERWWLGLAHHPSRRTGFVFLGGAMVLTTLGTVGTVAGIGGLLLGAWVLSTGVGTGALTMLVRDFFVVPRPEELPLVDALTTNDVPMVTVGRPDEASPAVGAVRMYLPRDDWQAPVRELMRRARPVVVVLGDGPGVLWELNEAMRILPPERLVLVVPMDDEEYEQFRETTATLRDGEQACRPGGQGVEWWRAQAASQFSTMGAKVAGL